jgi:hypothetical protein
MQYLFKCESTATTRLSGALAYDYFWIVGKQEVGPNPGCSQFNGCQIANALSYPRSVSASQFVGNDDVQMMAKRESS